MSERFAVPAELLSEPTLLVSTDGRVLAANSGAVEAFGIRPGAEPRLSDLVEDGRDRVADLLRLCSATRDPIIGALTFRTARGDAVVYRCDGALLSRPAEEGFAVVVLRCRPRDATVRDFAALDRRLRELNHEIQVRREAEDQLKAALDRHEVLLHELHHRVRNNLQLITSLVNLQYNHSRDDVARAACHAIWNRVKALAFVHKNLYGDHDLLKTPVRGVLTDLCRDLADLYGRGGISVKVESDDRPLGLDTAIPVFLIANELVSNALQHAFPNGRKGSVRAFFRDRAGDLELVVRDDGIGLGRRYPEETRGSLGLKLVEALARQIGAEVDVEASDGGTTFAIRFRDLQTDPAA